MAEMRLAHVRAEDIADEMMFAHPSGAVIAQVYGSPIRNPFTGRIYIPRTTMTGRLMEPLVKDPGDRLLVLV